MLVFGVLCSLTLVGCQSNKTEEKGVWGGTTIPEQEETINHWGQTDISDNSSNSTFGENPDAKDNEPVVDGTYDPADILSFNLTMLPKEDKYHRPTDEFYNPNYDNYSTFDMHDFVNNNATYKPDMYRHIDTWYHIYSMKEQNVTDYKIELNSLQVLLDIATNFDANTPKDVYKFHLDLSQDVDNHMVTVNERTFFADLVIPSLKTEETNEPNFYTADLGFYEDGKYYSFNVIDAISVYNTYDLKGLYSADIYLVPIGFEEQNDSINTYKLQFAVVGIENVVTYDTYRINQNKDNYDSAHLDSILNSIDTDRYDRMMNESTFNLETLSRTKQIYEYPKESVVPVYDAILGFNSSYEAVKTVDRKTGIVVIVGWEDYDTNRTDVLVVKFDNPDDMDYYDEQHDTPINNMLTSYDDFDGVICTNKAVYVDSITNANGITYDIAYTNIDEVLTFYQEEMQRSEY